MINLCPVQYSFNGVINSRLCCSVKFEEIVLSFFFSELPVYSLKEKMHNFSNVTFYSLLY